MPRLTQIVYERQRRFAITTFAERPSIIQYLKAAELRDIDLFFAALESLSPEQLVWHRREVARKDPSLPQRAGRAMRQLEAAVKGNIRPEMVLPVRRELVQRKGKQRRISIRAVEREWPDAKALARVIIEMAIEKHEREQRALDAKKDHDRSM